MSETSTLTPDEVAAFDKLALEAARDTSDLATLREMAVNDGGDHETRMIRVKSPEGDITEVPVTSIGKDALKRVVNPNAIAPASSDWHTPEH